MENEKPTLKGKCPVCGADIEVELDIAFDLIDILPKPFQDAINKSEKNTINKELKNE